MSNRNDVRQLAAKIESLAKETQQQLDSNGNFLLTANELIRNSLTFVFTLGEVFALERADGGKAVSGTKLKSRHNVRDALGRFTKKNNV